MFISGWTCREVLSQFSLCLASLNVASTVPNPLSWTRWQEVLQRDLSWWSWALGPGCTDIHLFFFFPVDCSSYLRFPVNLLPPQTPAGCGLTPACTAGRKGELGGGCLLCFPLFGLVWFLSVCMQKDSTA